MNARAEAFARLEGRYDECVLEPSPPTIPVGPWFADDPVGRSTPAAADLPRVSPVAGGDLRWADLIAEDPDLAAWCSERWLAAYRRLSVPPAGLATTRTALHRLAEKIMSSARSHANGQIALRSLHPEPYLYVVPWSRVPDGQLWQADHYRRAELPYADLLRADDQREAALSFYSERMAALTSAAAPGTKSRRSQA